MKIELVPVLALALGCAHLSCSHSKQVEDPSQREPPPAEEGGAAEQPASPTEPAAPDQSATGSGEQRGGKIAGGPRDPEEIPVASSPQGLLKPGAEKNVRERLGVKEGGSLRQALKKFQESKDLPATGILDHRTVSELGLDPDDVFERAQGQ